MPETSVSERETEIFVPQLERILGEENAENRAFYIATLGHDLVMDKCEVLERDRTMKEKVFDAGSPFASFLLPGVGGNESYEDPLRVFYRPGQINYERIFEVGGYHVARVPQAHLYEFPLEKKPLLYLNMTTCSALVANNDEKLYVAHIGLSETGEIVGALKFFEEQGIPASSVVAHASLGDRLHDSGVVKPHFDYRHAQMPTYLELGIQQENIFPFEYRFKQGDEENLHQDTRGVVVGNGFHVGFNFDMQQNAWDYTSDGELKGIVTVEC